MFLEGTVDFIIIIIIIIIISIVHWKYTLPVIYAKAILMVPGG